MKITVAQAREGHVQASRLIEGKRLPTKITFRLTRLLTLLEGVLKDASITERAIIERFTDRDESGQPIAPVDEHGNVVEDSVRLTDPKVFGDEMQALYDAEAEIAFEPITEADFEGREIDPADAIPHLVRFGLIAL